MGWIAWLVINADADISDDEAFLFRHLVVIAEQKHQVVDEELAQLVEHEVDEVLHRLDAEEGTSAISLTRLLQWMGSRARGSGLSSL